MTFFVVVKSYHDVHIALAPVLYQGEDWQKDLIEVVIGGYGNTLSFIRRGNQGTELCKAETPNILSGEEFRGFWITTKPLEDKGLEINFGLIGQTTPLMVGIDPDPVPFQFLGLASWANAEAFYRNVRTGILLRYSSSKHQTY